MVLVQRNVSPTFINMSLPSDQSNINADTIINFTELSSNGLSISSNKVLLTAGITYSLFCNLRLGLTGSPALSTYYWKNFTDEVNIGKGCVLLSISTTTNDSNSSVMSYVIKPETDILVGVVCSYVSVDNQKLSDGSTQASIYEL